MTLKAIIHCVSKHVRLSEPIKIRMKMDHTIIGRDFSAMTRVSGNIRFMRIFAEIPWRRGVNRKCGNRKHRFSWISDFGNLGNEANLII